MDKNAIKKYAVWARRELITRVSQRAAMYEITEKGYGDANADSVLGRVLSSSEKKQRQALINQIRNKGYEQVMEEVAYTWFNRFIALRFMEVNGYLPSHVRVFTDDENNFKPQILTEAINLEFDGLNMDKVYELKDANDDESLFKYLIIVQCNDLSGILPGMFQKIDDYTELLFPDNLLRSGSAIEQMITVIPEADWQDQVQIIGWLYQYYNTEPKDKVFNNLKKNIKISKENIPAATQLFTPDWIVRYMVENSLGRLWIEGHPNESLKDEWKYYVDEPEQEPEVQCQISKMCKEYERISPSDIKCIDPCSGSGHILAYMFDVLVQIYEAYGYSAREAASNIVENNIYGLDIDNRAAQLAYFSLMMKARQYDSRFFRRGKQPHIYAVQESNDLNLDAVAYFCDGREELKNDLNILIGELHDAKEYGSILNISTVNYGKLYERFNEICNDISMYREYVLTELYSFVQLAETMSQKYHVVVTNPPYMGNGGMNDHLQDFVKKNYVNGKSDMFAVFTIRASNMCVKNGFYALITQPSILFLSSFEKLRLSMIKEESIMSLIHMGRGIFGVDWGSTSFVVRKQCLGGYRGQYYKPHERTFQYIESEDIERFFLKSKEDPEFRYDFSQYKPLNTIENQYSDEALEDIESGINRKIAYSFKQSDFLYIPGAPIAFAMSPQLLFSFKGKNIKDFGYAGIGMRTGDNAKYLRLWNEVDWTKIVVDAVDWRDAVKREAKWIPYNKGGDFRKWYGNNSYVVNWENNGYEIKENTKKTYPQLGDNLGWKISNESYYFKPGITWSGVSSGAFSCRNYGTGYIFDSGANGLFSYKEDDAYYLAGLLNSNLGREILQIINPTINTGAGTINSVPVIMDNTYYNQIVQLVKNNITISKEDWDCVETSWDFEAHPLVKYGCTSIREAYRLFSNELDKRYCLLKQQEEEINKIINKIYGVENDIPSKVMDKYIAIKRSSQKEDICSLISYAVGCMFGRYSLDVSGIAYAGGEWDETKYHTFMPDRDNIIPICDDDYFDDDITGCFVKWVSTVFGKTSLEDNLSFIAESLDGTGSSRDIIRSYFINSFYADHCAMYSVSSSGKRPIYWLFDSGKKNGFKALIYMHRYKSDTIARIRTDYVHEQQSRYRTAITEFENRIKTAGTSERVKLNKTLKTLKDQAEEIRVYEEKIHHLADQMISIDLDDGVKTNYAKFQDVLAKIK